MTKQYRNHNIRFSMTDEGGMQAWERLHSEEVEQSFKSQNAFVVAAINDYYERHLAKKNDRSAIRSRHPMENKLLCYPHSFPEL